MNERVEVKDVIPQSLAIVHYGTKDEQSDRSQDSPMHMQYLKSGGTPQGMTYRVVHVNTTSGGSGEVVQQQQQQQQHQQAVQLTSQQQETQLTDAQMAYIPAGATSDGLATLSAGAGSFYVISSPQEVGLATAQGRVSGTRGGCEVHRDDRRRATHNEVERRRRDKINSWITKLGKLLPESGDPGKANQSKGAVLSQACDYVQDTRGIQQKFSELFRDNEKLHEDIKMLKQSNEALVTANQLLKAHLKSQGAVILENTDAQTGGH